MNAREGKQCENDIVFSILIHFMIVLDQNQIFHIFCGTSGCWMRKVMKQLSKINGESLSFYGEGRLPNQPFHRSYIDEWFATIRSLKVALTGHCDHSDDHLNGSLDSIQR